MMPRSEYHRVAVVLQQQRPREGGGEICRWHLTDVERAKRFRKPSGRPQPVWFNPF